MGRSFATYGYENPKNYQFKFDGLTLLFVVIFLLIFLFGVALPKSSIGGVVAVSAVVGIIMILIFQKVISNSRKIIIGNSYILEGRQIVFLSNLTELHIDYLEGKLTLKTSLNTLTIESIYFPAESKKDFKIKISQKKKFNKISQKIHKKVSQNAPNAEITIINSSRGDYNA